MSAYAFIIPALTAVSFFIYIFMSHAAWLPKSGTTEWITRIAFPQSMTPDSIHSPYWTDYISAVGAAVIYAALSSLCFISSSSFSTSALLCSACAGITVGSVFITGRMLFGSSPAAVLSAVFTAADVSFLFTVLLSDIAICAGLMLAAVYTVTVCFSMKHPLFLIASGLLLGCAMYLNPGFIIFMFFGAVAVFAAAGFSGKKQLYWMFPVFSVFLPCVICCLASYFTSGNAVPEFLTVFAYHAIDPVYLGCAAVCVIFAAVHIFRSKSFSALFIFAGVAAAVGCIFLNVPALCLFSGLAIAYPGSIVISRGRGVHKVFTAVFAVVVCAGLLISLGLFFSTSTPPVYDILSRISEYWVYLLH